MADNYLENKMDDYRRGVTAKTSRRSSSCAASISSPISLPPHNIILFISTPGLLSAILDVFHGIQGMKVAFAATDAREGSKLAQSTGSMFVPVRQLDAAAVVQLHKEATRRWNAVDVIMTDCPDCVHSACSITAARAIVPAPKTIVFNFFARSGEVMAMDSSDVVINIRANGADFHPVARAAMLLLSSQAAPISAMTLQLH